MMSNQDILHYSAMSEVEIIKRMDSCKKTYDFDYFSFLMQLLNNVRVAKILSCKLHKLTEVVSE